MNWMSLVPWLIFAMQSLALALVLWKWKRCAEAKERLLTKVGDYTGRLLSSEHIRTDERECLEEMLSAQTDKIDRLNKLLSERGDQLRELRKRLAKASSE